MDSEYRRTVLAITIAVIISLIISILLMVYVVPPYLRVANRAVNVFEFYEHVSGNNNIYFIGNSMVGFGVDCEILGERSNQYNFYNLVYPSDSPLRRITEMYYIKESKPVAVLIGLSYNGLNDSYFNPNYQADNIVPVANYVRLESSAREILPKKELELIDMNSRIYNRKFIIPSLLALIGYRDDTWIAWNFSDFIKPCDPNLDTKKNKQEVMDRLNDSKEYTYYVVSNETTDQKCALKYIINDLRKAGIPVIILNMPLNPCLSARISNESRTNYFEFLNSTGVIYFDFEKTLQIEYFSNHVHQNRAGQIYFSKNLCHLVANESFPYYLS